MSNAESTVSDVVIRNYRPGDEHSSLALIDAAPDFPYYWFNRSASLDALRTVPSTRTCTRRTTYSSQRPPAR